LPVPEAATLDFFNGPPAGEPPAAAAFPGEPEIMEAFGTLAAVPRSPDLEFADSEIARASEPAASAAVTLSAETSPVAAMFPAAARFPVALRAIATEPPSSGKFSASSSAPGARSSSASVANGSAAVAGDIAGAAEERLFAATSVVRRANCVSCSSGFMRAALEVVTAKFSAGDSVACICDSFRSARAASIDSGVAGASDR
jgi:hypothetical protein